jgi:ATP-binding cassette, subfamily G (WHITE), member 2
VRNVADHSSFLRFTFPSNNSPKNLPAYFAWLDAVSYVKYAYIGAALNENAGLVLRCTAKELRFNSKGESICPVTSGAQVMADLGMLC